MSQFAKKRWELGFRGPNEGRQTGWITLQSYLHTVKANSLVEWKPGMKTRQSVANSKGIINGKVETKAENSPKKNTKNVINSAKKRLKTK